jgi:hypothetical protein
VHYISNREYIRLGKYIFDIVIVGLGWVGWWCVGWVGLGGGGGLVFFSFTHYFLFFL